MSNIDIIGQDIALESVRSKQSRNRKNYQHAIKWFQHNLDKGTFLFCPYEHTIYLHISNNSSCNSAWLARSSMYSNSLDIPSDTDMCRQNQRANLSVNKCEQRYES